MQNGKWLLWHNILFAARIIACPLPVFLHLQEFFYIFAVNFQAINKKQAKLYTGPGYGYNLDLKIDAPVVKLLITVPKWWSKERECRKIKTISEVAGCMRSLQAKGRQKKSGRQKERKACHPRKEGELVSLILSVL